METIVKADFDRIYELGSYLRGLDRVLGEETVRSMYNYDRAHVSDRDDYAKLAGFDVIVREMYRCYADGGELYPFRRLAGLSDVEVVHNIKGWLSSRSQDLHSGITKSDFLDRLGSLCGEGIEPNIRLKALSLFGQAAGYISNAQVNVDASQKTIIAEMDKLDSRAQEVVDRYRVKEIGDR